jgi:hypothetical protein
VKGVGLALVVMGLASVGMADIDLPPPGVPEIDGGMLASGLTLISGAALIVGDRLRRHVK